MNERIRKLYEQAHESKPVIALDPLTGQPVHCTGHNGKPMYHRELNLEKFAELIVRELVSQLKVEGCEFYYNEVNNYGCITVKYFVGGDPARMRGEEEQAKFWGGEVRGTGYYHLNEQFVQHLMEQHFGVEE